MAAHDQRRWLRQVRESSFAQMLEPWHLEGFVANAGGAPMLLGAACSTTFTDPELVEWREPSDPPPLRERCDACQGALARGEAVG